jgi:hypothetical protein
MRPLRLLLPLVLAPVLAACTAVRHDFGSSVDLGPGGRAEGSLALHDGGLVSLRLRNRGPGRVDYDLRTPSGRVLSSGPLDSVLLVPDDAACAEGRVVLVLEAFADAGATVGVLVSAESGPGCEWDLSRAHP